MLKNQVKIGNEYEAKVSGKRVPVRINGFAANGHGWVGTNSITGRAVRIKTAGRLKELRREHCSNCGQRTAATSLGLSICVVCAGIV